MRKSLILSLLMSLLAGGLAIPRPAMAAGATIVVNSLEDKLNNSDGKCTLREAMMRAFDNASTNPNNDCAKSPSGVTTINFAVAGTIVISNGVNYGGLPDTINTLTLIGPITIDASKANQILFDVESSGKLSLVNVTIKNAAYTAIDSRGEVNIAGGSFINNSAGGAGGAAIRADGKTVIAGTTFTGNKAVNAGQEGGAIRSTWDLTIAGSTFQGNLADKNGGAISVRGGKFEISDTAFTGNIVKGSLLPSATGEGGGALFTASSSNVYTMTVKRSAFTGNTALEGVGGAIFHTADTLLTVSDSMFTGNHAGSPGAGGQGGAIKTIEDLTLIRDMFIGNSVEGSGGGLAIQRNQPVKLRLVGFSGNNASDLGGAILYSNTLGASGGTMSVIGAQLTANIAGNKGGGIYNQESQYDKAEFRLSVFGGNLPQNCRDKDPSDDKYPVGAVGPIDSKGQNAFSDDTCDDPDSNNDVHETDLKLGPLQYNGGPPGMLTQVPDIDSPLVDRIDPVTYVVDPDIGNKDIRGRPRQADGNGNGLYYFDIGSVERDDSQPEFVSIPAAPGPINLGSVAINTTITKTNALRIFNAGDAPLVLSNVGLGGSFPAEFAVVGAFPTTITAASSVTVAMTCRPTVAAARSATLNMNTNDPNLPSRSFNLSCGGLAAAVNAGFGSTPESPGLLSAETTAGKPVVMTITVRETGNATLSLGAGTLTSSPAGAFGGLTGLSTTIVDGGADKLVTVQCLATSVGLKSATLSFSTNDPSRPTANYTFTCNVLKGKDDLFGSTYSNSSAPINGPYGVAVSPDAQHVYVADSGGSGVTRYDVLGGNSLSYQATYASASLSVSRRFTSPEQVAVSPDGANVYVTGVTGDSIAVYARDQSSGDLTHMETVRNGSSYGCVNTLQVNQPSAGPICSSLSGMDGAYGIAFSPGGEHVYVTTKYSSTVMVFGRQTSGAETGSLEYPSPSILRTAFLQRYTNTLLSAAYGVAVSPDGANVYVTGYTSDALITLDRDASNGRLTTRQVLTSSAASGLNGVFRVTISADGKHVYTAAYDSDSVCAFTRSQVNGALTPIACYTSAELNAASDVALSPDGRMLFATGYSGNSLTAFERDMDTGGLTFRDVITKGISGFPRIAGARGVVINPNGQAAYVTGHTDDATVAIIFNAPSPVATGLAPLSVAQGYASPLPVTVSGVDFQANSVVRVGGANRATTYKSKTELAATLLASDFSAAGERQITVNTPTPGGGTSNVLTFTVLAPGAIPVPAVALLSPQSVLAGSGAQTIEVRGTGFIASAVVLFNNAARATTWLSSTLIRGALLAGDVAQAGTALISVDNSPSLLLPEVAGTTSNALALEITAPELPPAPSISALQPAAAAARGPAAQVPITITGLNFSLNSQALWNDDPRPTQYVSPTRLIATISAADLILEGSAGVSVNTPGPGGGDSNVLGFTITPPPSYVYLPLVRR